MDPGMSSSLSAVMVSLILLYALRELRSSLGKISTDIQDLKRALENSSRK